MFLWNRIELEDFMFPKVVDYKNNYLIVKGELPLGVGLSKITESMDERILANLEVGTIQGVGEKFTSFANDFYNSGIALYVPKSIKIKEPIKVEFELDNDNPIIIDKNIIVAEPDSEVTIVFDYSSKSDCSTFHNGLTQVFAKENSVVNIIKIQRINYHSPNFDSNLAFVKGRGKVNWISVELGSSISGSNYTTFLDAEASESHLNSIYMINGTRKMDLEYTMIHRGVRSESNIESRGVLMDHAKKVFRGNLDFKKGSKRSRGVEEEFVLLFDPTVKSDSIPALLCGEDDVQGEHAASAGQINHDSLFYLMSRGLTERQAKKLIVESSFRPIIDQIPLDDIRDIVNSEISRRLFDA